MGKRSHWNFEKSIVPEDHIGSWGVSEYFFFNKKPLQWTWRQRSIKNDENIRNIIKPFSKGSNPSLFTGSIQNAVTSLYHPQAIPSRLSWGKERATTLITQARNLASLGSSLGWKRPFSLQLSDVVQETGHIEQTLPHVENNPHSPQPDMSRDVEDGPVSAQCPSLGQQTLNTGDRHCQLWALWLRAVGSRLESPAVNSIPVLWRSCVHAWLHPVPASTPGLQRPFT